MRTLKTVAIVGSAPGTREDAPFDDLSKEIWVFNEAAEIPWCKRATAVLQMHLPEVYRSPLNRTDPEHWNWLQQRHGLTVWMQEVDPLIPDSAKYPLDEIVGRYRLMWPDGEAIRYFTSTPSYAVALACYQQFDRIEIYGCEMHSSTEYQYQRDNFAYWVGVAGGQGIDVEMHGGQAIFDMPLYGYEGTPVYSLKEIEKELEFLEGQNRKRATEFHAAEVDDLAATPGTPEYYDVHSRLIDATVEAGYSAGMLAEAKRHLKRGGLPIRQEFEQQAAMHRDAALAFASMMNHDNGRCECLLELGEVEKYRAATKRQLEHAYAVGEQKGKGYFNKQHMLHMDLLLRSAGGAKAAQYAAESQRPT